MTDEQQEKPEWASDFRMPTRRKLDMGEVVEGTVVSIGESEVFVDIGGKSEAMIDLKEFVDDEGEVKVKIGDEVSAFVVSTDPELVLSHALAREHLNLQALQDAHDMGIPVEGKVTGVNKGGFEVDLNGRRAFCPISQIELGFCEDPSVHVDNTYEFRVVECAEDGRNIVVSRRALEQEKRELDKADTMAQMHEGAEFEGEVVTLKPYGAFVEIGGMQGMVHISEISHQRLEHPSEALQIGQRVRVKVLRIEPDKKNPDRQRVGLSIRALLGNPWDEVVSKLKEGGTVSGKVVRLQPFGAFVEIAPGVDGLIHISELADRRVGHPQDVVTVGETVTATILKVDIGARRISLSLRSGGDEYASDQIAAGNVVKAVVDRIKPFGLFVRIKGAGKRARGLIPNDELPSGQHGAYPEGTEVDALIVSVDHDSGKIRLSIKAIAEQEERRTYQQYAGSEKASGEKRGFGTLGDALAKALKKD